MVIIFNRKMIGIYVTEKIILSRHKSYKCKQGKIGVRHIPSSTVDNSYLHYHERLVSNIKILRGAENYTLSIIM